MRMGKSQTSVQPPRARGSIGYRAVGPIQTMIEVVGEKFIEGPAVDFREYLGERVAATQSASHTDGPERNENDK